jgi:LruC domain-containing protein
MSKTIRMLNQMKLSRLFRLLLAVPALSVVMMSCSKDDEPLKLADDILPNETYENTPLPESSLTKVVVCNQRSSCLINMDQVSKGEAVLYNDDAGNFYIDFNLGAGLKIKTIYLFIGLQEKQIPRFNNGMAAVENYPYIKTFDQATLDKFTYKINLGDDEQCWFVSAKVEAEQAGSTNPVSLWMGCTSGSNSVDAFYIGKNIANGLFVGFCQKSCTPIDYTFAFEDLASNSNDMDYNDLVIQARYIETKQANDELTNISMTFFAKARGASYDHEFSIAVPVKGSSTTRISRYNAIGQLLSQENLSRNGVVNCVIFPSTKQALPPNGFAEVDASNADTTRDASGFPPCLVRSWKTVINITINNPAANVSGTDLTKPYDPYVIVKPTTNPTSFYTLRIYEISQDPADLFEGTGGMYPSGLIVPSDWAWPLERKPIKSIYPDFPNPDWFDNKAPDATGYFVETLFGPPCF